MSTNNTEDTKCASLSNFGDGEFNRFKEGTIWKVVTNDSDLFAYDKYKGFWSNSVADIAEFLYLF